MINASTQYQLTASDLEVLLALTRGGNLAEAGKRLAANASTVFRTVQRIEKQLGQTLFTRSRSGYLANDIALSIVAHAERIETELDAARAASQASQDEVSGVVRLTTTDSILQGMVIPKLAELAALHPRLRLELLASNDVANLSKRDADIAIRGTSKPPEHLVGHHLGRAQFALYVSKALYEAKGREKDPNAYDWIVLDETMPDHPALRWRKKNYPKVMPRYYLGSLLALGEAVRCGLGVGMLSTFRAKNDPSLQPLTPILDECGIDIWILAHPESRHLRRIATVYTYFSKVLRFG
ncbi:MAG: LysR family transcriptional regulator [Betaproteobacteria bacterium]